MQPGIVITEDNKTLNGFINYKEWEKNPSTVEFSSTRNENDVRIFGISDIRYFEITGAESYEKHKCRISLSKAELNRLSYGPDSASMEEMIFLKVLQKGKLTLYRYADDIKQRFYIKAENQTMPEELQNSMYYDTEVTTNLTEKKEYRDQLLAEAEIAKANNSRVLQKINNARYAEGDLVRIITLINNGGSAEKKINGNQLKKTSFYAGAGVNLASFSLTGDRTPYPAGEYSFSSSVSPVILGGLNIYLNPGTARLFLRSELSFFFNSHTADAKISTLAYTYDYKYEVKYSVAALFIGANYSFIHGKNADAYLSAGPSLQVASVSKNKEHETRYSVFIPGLQDDRDIKQLEVSNFWFGYNLRAGVIIKKTIDIGLCFYGQKRAFELYSNFKDVTSYAQLHVGYIFKNKQRNK